MMCRTVYLVLVAAVGMCVADLSGADNTMDKTTKKPILRVSDLFDKAKMEDHYPEVWTQMDYRPIIDNDRLFKKYKDCILAEKSIGCPRMVTEFKKLIPEIIDTLCAKCLPIHIEKFKEAATYICHKRRADYDEVRRIKDPDGSIQARFEEKYGKLEC